jgi:hypothetical protein
MSKQVRVRFFKSNWTYILAEFVPHYSIICLPKKQWYFLPEIEYRPKSFVPGAEEYMEA